MELIEYYKYLFYKVLHFLRSLPFKDNTTEWSAMFILESLAVLNFFSIINFIQIFTGKPFLPNLNRLELTIAFLIITILYYFVFLYKKKYENIIKKFEVEPIEKKKKGNYKTLLYVLGSWVLFFLFNIIKLIIWGAP